MIIYKVTNTITNQCYIGQTTNSLHNRMVDHVYEAFQRKRNDKFHAALREYGCENFTWEELAKINSNYTDLYKKERYFIIKYDSINNGYNSQIRKDKR